jgi:tRNA A-37 threonylcarbamoyl transferase component Bud32
MPDWEVFYNRFREPGFIAGYEIQNRLGGGAFGDVYKARKLSIGKVYAVKFLKLDESALREMVERELEQVRHFASIDHPHLVTIEDMGVVMDVPYLIMGYAGEDTLARRLARGELDRDAALRFFVQACRGVLALHDRRLAHFDLKPSNVFLKGDVARVGDYGLAKLLADGRQTLSFGRGTPHYMAPEILQGKGDHRADVYSLGVILYESVAGRLPYDGGDGPSSFVLRTEDVPPAFDADFPPELRGVVERALRIDPDHRFADLHELLGELGQSARQGDSVALPWDAGAVRVTPARGGDVPGEPGGSDLTRATRELALGAVDVARGVWEAVSTGEGDRDVGTRESEPLGPDVLSMEPLRAESAAADTPPARGFFARPAPSPRAPAPPPVATVPVPPRARGGVFGSAWATALLGLEILLTLAAGPVRWAARLSGRTAERIAQVLPGVLGSAVRLVLFVLLCAAAGAVLTTAAMYILTEIA